MFAPLENINVNTYESVYVELGHTIVMSYKTSLHFQRPRNLATVIQIRTVHHVHPTQHALHVRPDTMD